MELNRHFLVPADIDVVWAAFNSPDLLASCFPGVTLDQVNGTHFAGSVKVKLGAGVIVFDGGGEYVRPGKTIKPVVIKISASDRRGRGTVTALITVRFHHTAAGTEVDLHTKLAMTGKPAQLGPAVVQHVSAKLVDQFVACISTKLGQGVSIGQLRPAMHGASRPGTSTGAGKGMTPGAPIPPGPSKRYGSVLVAAVALFLVLRTVSRVRRAS